MSTQSSTESRLAHTSLCIWPAYGKLPSFDPECLCVLAHLAFARLNIPLESKLNRLKFFKERLPLLISEDEEKPLAAGYEAIIRHCQKSHIDIDEGYSTKAADLLALQAYVKSNFVPAVLDTFWIDEVYRGSVINIYARSLGGFPLAYIYGKQTTGKIKDQLEITNGPSSLEQIQKLTLEKGRKVLDHLSHVLETKPFLFGASPTSVDAFVFGYLAPLIHGPAANSALARHASSRKNLRDFVDRILTIYLGDLPRGTTPVNESNAGASRPRVTEDRLRDKVAVVAIGVLTMCAYAYFTGLIRVEVSQVE